MSLTGWVRLGAVLALSWMMVAGARAQQLPIAGTWGDENGCKVEAEGVAFTDAYAILRAGEFRQHESLCEFVDVKTAPTGEYVVRTLCGGEGELWLRDFVMVSNADDKSMTVHFGAGGEPLTVRPCG